MKQMCAVVLVFSLFVLSASAFAVETQTISFDFDLSQFCPKGGETEEELQELARQFKAYDSIMTDVSSPVWSPDGSLITFSSSPSNTLWTYAPGGGDPEIVDREVMESITYTWEYNENVVAENRDPGEYSIFYKSIPVFTPDGKEITYMAYYFDASRGSIFNQHTGSREIKNMIPAIESIDLASGEKRELVNEGRSPAWSPNGRYLAYVNFDSRIFTDSDAAENNGALAVLDTVTGETSYPFEYHTNESYDSSGIISPSFSPDGSQIVFIYEKRICIISADGGEITRLTNSGTDTTYPTNPQFSPDGRWILFDYNRNLLVYDTTDGRIHKVSSGEIVDDLTAITTLGKQGSGSWSPDGSTICAYEYNKKTITYPGGYDRDYMNARELCLVDFDAAVIEASKPTAVEETAPSAFALTGNYPNPFNPTTMIGFTLAETGITSLVIFNGMGQKIRELVSGELCAGAHEVLWDGRNDSGIAVSSGIYYSRLKAGDSVTARQMMMIK